MENISQVQKTTTIEFFLYMKDLNKYKSQVYIEVQNDLLGKKILKQLSDIDKDIFYVSYELQDLQKISTIKYHYGLEKSIITDDISRDLKKFKVEQITSQQIVKIFDVPHQFYEKAIFSSNKQILKQEQSHFEILVFAQLNSPYQMLLGLKNFIEKSQLGRQQNLLKELSEQLFNQLNELKANHMSLTQISERIRIFSPNFLKEKSFQIYEKLINFYQQENQDLKKLNMIQKVEFNNLSKYFKFKDWIQIYMQNLIFEQEDIFTGMKESLQNSSKLDLLDALNSIKILQESKISDQNEQYNLQNIFQKYWIAYYEQQNQNEKLGFLIINSQSLISQFSENQVILNNIAENYLETMICSDQNIDQFLDKSQQFIELYDKEGTIIKKVLSDQAFKRLKESKQINLFNFFSKRNINLEIRLQSFLERVLLQEDNKETIKSTIELIILKDPFLNIKDSLINNFSKFLKNLYKLELINCITHKQIFISLLKLQCQLQTQQYQQPSLNQSYKIAEKDIQIFEEELDQILAKKLSSFNLPDILSSLDSIQTAQDLENATILLQKIFKLNIESSSNNNQIFLQNYDNVYNKYIKAFQNNELNGKQIYEMVLNQYEELAIKKYEEKKTICLHFYDEFTYHFLQKQSQNFQQIVLNDLQIFDDRNINILEIETLIKLLSCQNFENIFNFFSTYLGNFQLFKQKHMDTIDTYNREKQKLNKFFQRTKNYFEKEYQFFNENCNDKQQLGNWNNILSQFNHIQILYELYNHFSESQIFQRMFILIEDKYKKNSDQKDNMNNILFYLKQNLIKFAFLLTGDQNNQQLLNIFEIKYEEKQIQQDNNYMSNPENKNKLVSLIELNKDVRIIQFNGQNSIQEIQMQESQQLKLEKKLNIFENSKITLNLLRHLAGDSYVDSFRNISTFLNTMGAQYEKNQIEQILKNIYLSEFLYKQGSALINLSKQFNIDLDNKENKEFYLQLQQIVGNKQFYNQSLSECNKKKYLMSYELSQIQQIVCSNNQINILSISLIDKLDEIIQYIQNNLKNSTFLDLRDLVDEDDTDVISLIIKLNNLNPKFQQLIQIKQELPKNSSFQKMVLEIILFMQKSLIDTQTCLDIEECINNFYKISNISRTFDKKKQFITLSCEIIQEGTIIFSLVSKQDTKNSVNVSIQCKKEYSEEEIRQICSKVILEENTTTNSLLAAAHINMQKNPKRQSLQSHQQHPNIVIIKQNNQLDDHFVNLNNQQQREEELLQDYIQEIKLKMQKFRNQWFLAEQIKEILQELIMNGSCEEIRKEYRYDNKNNQYQQKIKQMSEDYLHLKKQLDIWKQQLNTIYSKYPYFTIIGINYYQQLIKLFSQSSYQLNQESDLYEQLQIIGNKEFYIKSFSQKVDQAHFKQLKEHAKIEFIAKICTENSNLFIRQQQQMDYRIQNRNKIFQIRYSGKKELIQILMIKMQSSLEQQHFYQYFFYDQQTQIQDLELFLARYKYLSTNPNGAEYFIIFQEKLDSKFLNSSINLLKNIFNNQSQIKNKLFILLKQDILMGDISIIPTQQESEIISQHKIVKEYSKQYQIDYKRVEIIYSDHPGAGKSFYIQQQLSGDITNKQMIRIPTNGSGEKESILECLRQKKLALNYINSIHIDLYENLDYDLNIMLFELIFLKSISIHSQKLLYFDSKMTIFIEVSNTLNDEFLNSLYIKEYFTFKKLKFDIENFWTNDYNLIQQDKINQFTCFKYLQALLQSNTINNYLDQSELSNVVFNENNNYQQEFIQILKVLFINKLQEFQIQPCFHQLQNFIQLFGSEMQKFEKCWYLKIQTLQQIQQDLLNSGIRTNIMRMSYNICLRVSINNTKKEFQNLNGYLNLSKQQILDNKAQSIEKFSNLMMNFLTFQEQEVPSITSFFQNKHDVPQAILSLYEAQKEKILYFNEQNSSQDLLKWLIMLIHENVAFMYSDQNSSAYEHLCHTELQKTVERITIQKDNFFKIAMIFMRIRSNSPVIIMGQSGIGKTALVEVMSLIMNAKFYTMSVHAGIQEKDVINFIDKIKKANQKSDNKIILFFDEVNTNKLVGGLFKEILVDRCLKGEKFPRNFIPIAAINPYKLKSEKQKEIINLQIHGGIKQELVDKIRNIDLEYMVEPIPESMYSFIWNFDSLNAQDEYCYIKQMIAIKNEIKQKKYKIFDKNQIASIQKTVNFSQMAMRNEMGYQSACSLRDVSRFTKLLFWFAKTLKIFQEFGLYIEQLSTYSICLSFFVNYCVRLPLYETRKKYLEDCAQNLNITYSKLHEIIDRVQTFLIDQLEIPEGIVKNTALKQNVFTLFVSIMNKIPIVLIGPPGCSKTLSLRILIQSMKGQQSKSPFFQRFKALMQLFYQGHIQSTSERILEVFENAKQKQKKIVEQGQKKNYLSLVYMEEIGLAEISPHNPLKVLHSTLEKPEIAVACISNWPLDQSKMNRMLAVYRLNINIDELAETIQCIQKQIIQKEENDYNRYVLNENLLSDSVREQISKVYLNYLSFLKKDLPKFEQFHGLRDFYSMTKLLCYQQLDLIKNQVDQRQKSMVQYNLYDRIIQCFLRHFSGLKDAKSLLIRSIKTVFKNITQQQFNNISTDLQLIDQNLSEKSKNFISRHLMIITENTQCVAEYISRKLITMKRSHKVIQGSDFRNDQSLESSYSIINQIISCVESGIIVIIQNLDNIYQSLYELLNQNYRNFNGKNYCKISFGADSSNIEVSPNFKLILLTHQSQIHRMDGPLLNRFEKHTFNENMTISELEKERINIIMKYFDSHQDLFDFSNLQEVIQSLLIQQRELGNVDLKNTDIIQMIYHLTSLSKCQISSNDQNDNQFKQEYINSNYHFSLQEFIKNRINNPINNPQKSRLITIFSPSYCQYQLLLNITYSTVMLSQLDSQQTFIEKINLFFRNNNQSSNFMYQSIIQENCKQNLISNQQNGNYGIQDIRQENEINQLNQRNPKSKPKILLVIADLNYDSFERINLIRQKIQEAFTNIESENNEGHNFQVILTIKINDVFTVLPYSGQWEQYYIEDLFPLNFINNYQIEQQFNVQMLLNNKGKQFLSMFKIKQLFQKFIQSKENITNSYRNIQYRQINKENYQTQRLNELWRIFCNDNIQLKKFISLCIIIAQQKFNKILAQQEIQTVDDFITKIILKRGYAQQTTSLANAIWNGFNDLLQQSMSLIIYQLEKNNFIFALSNCMQNDKMISYITQKFIQTFNLNIDFIDFSNEIYNGDMDDINFKQMKYELDQNTLDLQYPYSEAVNSIVDKIIKNAQAISNSITSDKSQDEDKTLKFKDITSQIEINIKEIFKQNEIEEIIMFQNLLQDDYFVFRKKEISQQQIIIIECILNLPNYEYKHQEGFISKIIKIIVFANLYLYDLQKIEEIINVFSKLIKVENILNNFMIYIQEQKRNAQTLTIRDFICEIVKQINISIQPSNEFYKIVKYEDINLEGDIQQLIYFIDEYLIFNNQEILAIKQQLLVLSKFLRDIVLDLNFHIKILSFVDIQQIQSLDNEYIQDLKNELQGFYQKSNLYSSMIQDVNQIDQINKGVNQQQKSLLRDEKGFEEKWNEFVLELALCSIKSNDKNFSPEFTRSVLQLLHNVEQQYLKINKILNIPSQILIKFNIILIELVQSINSIEKLIDIFQNEHENPIIDQGKIDSTEYAYLVMLSNALQQQLIQKKMNTISENKITYVLYNSKIQNLTLMQKLIYLSIFRQTIQVIINTINNKLQFRTIDKSLQEYFKNLSQPYLQLYVAKVFYHQYKQGDIMVQKMNQSPYLKGCKWLEKYSQSFKGLLSSSFLNQQQLLCYKEQFEKQNVNLKSLFQEYFQKNLKKSQNIFGQIYNGNFIQESFYPYMMNNNIDLFHRDSQNNTQLYQCSKCLEYIFSNACPNLTSSISCLQCGVMLAKGNQNTIQVLQNANQHQQQLQNIRTMNQWQGFYIRLEEDQNNYKIDQGTVLDLRIFSILYYFSFLLAYQQNNKYRQAVQMRVHNFKQNQEININTQRINRILRIHYEAQPNKFMNEQLDIAFNHTISILKTQYKMTDKEIPIILFKIFDELLQDQSIRPTDQQNRIYLNTQLSNKVQQFINQSQKAISEVKSEDVDKILEKDSFNIQDIKQNYLRNLRATDFSLNHDFIQNYLKQNLKNDQYQILKEFLDISRISYIQNGLRILVKFTQMMNTTFMKCFTKKRAQEITLLDALDKKKNHPLYIYFVDNVIPVWKQIKEKELVFQIGCQEHTIELINEQTKLNNLVYTDNKSYGYFPNIIELLINSQNNFISKIYQLSQNENNIEFTKVIQQIQYFLFNSAQNKLKEMPIQSLDPERNIIKQYNPDIYSHYFLCNIEISKGFEYIQDLNSLQEDLVQKVLYGAISINIESSQKFFFLSEINQIGLLADFQTEQEKIPFQIKQELFKNLQNKSQIFELLSQMSTVFQIFKFEKNQGGLSLKSALEQLTIKVKDKQIGNILQQLQLVHINDLITYLQDLNMDNLVELCNPLYKNPLKDDIFEKAINFIDQTVNSVNFKLALGRFILRYTSSEQENISTKENLFSQLFYIDVYEELWDDISNVEENYEKACQHQITIGQAYDFYIKTNKYCMNQMRYYKPKMKNDNKANNKTNLMMENFSDKRYTQNLKDQMN